MTINEMIHTIMELNKLGDTDGNIARNWELCWWMCVHCAEY